MPLDRRTFLTSLAGALSPLPAAAKSPVPERIVSLDYALATSLLALGVTPIGVAAAETWDRWVVEPPLPPEVIDIGSDSEVNFEILAALRPDLILITAYVRSLAPQLERIAPTLELTIYAPDGDPLERARTAIRTLGTRLDRAGQATAYLDQADSLFTDYARRVAALRAPDLLLLNYMDARHARVFGRHSLYQSVLDRIGIENAWTRETNYWGFSTVGLEQLATAAGPETHLIAFEPIPPDVHPTLSNSPLWTRLPFVRAGRVSTLPGVLMFGGVPSALRFARLVVERLESVTA